MQIKNLVPFRIALPWPLAATQLEELLQRRAHRPPGQLEEQSWGWVPAQPGFPLVLHCQGFAFLVLRVDIKRVPKHAVNREVRERVDKLRAERGGKGVGKDERKAIKAQVTESYLPKIIPSESYTGLLIDPKNGWVGVDVSGANKAKDVIAKLRASVETLDLPIQTLAYAKSPEAAMSDWLASGDAPEGFTIDDSCELVAPDESKATVRYTKTNLNCDNVKEHIKSGKTPTKLAMTFNSRVSCVLTSAGEIRRLKFHDVVFKDSGSAEDLQEQFQGSLVIVGEEVAKLISGLVQVLGGLHEDEDPEESSTKPAAAAQSQSEPVTA